MNVIELFNGAAPAVGPTVVVPIRDGFGAAGQVSKGVIFVTGEGITDWTIDVLGTTDISDVVLQRVQRLTHSANTPYAFEVILMPAMAIQVTAMTATNLVVKLLV